MTAMPQILTFDSEAAWLELRKQDITSTEIAALFGVSPYATRFEVWNEKAGRLDTVFNDNERVAWGRRLEPVIAAGLAEEHGLTIAPLKNYMRHATVKRMGSSFDFEILDPQRPDLEVGVFEIKNVDSLIFRQQWVKDGDHIEAPVHIELQLQHQLAVSGRKWGAIGVLIGGNEANLIRRERDEEAIAPIESEVAAFWASIDAGEMPEPDFTRDLDTLKDLYRKSEDVPLPNEDRALLAQLLPQFEAAKAAVKTATAERDALQSRILFALKTVESATVGEFKLSAKTSIRKGYTVADTESRPLRVTKIKPAKAAA